MGAVTINHGAALQVRFPAAGRDRAGVETPRGTKNHRIECRESREHRAVG